MLRRTGSERPISLARVLERAVGHALSSGSGVSAGLLAASALACGGQSAGVGVESLSPEFSFPDGTGVPEEAGGESSEGATTPAGPVEHALDEDACATGQASRLVHMQLSEPYDFVALRMIHGDRRDPLAASQGQELETLGRACEGADDTAACRAELDAAWPGPASGWMECGQAGCYTYGLVTTRGNEVELHQGLADILAVLGPIDTPVEAVFWADANGYAPRCLADTVFGLPSLKLVEVETGYRLRNYEMVASCPIVFEGVVLDIARDGRLSEAERFPPPPSGVSGCVGRRPPGLMAQGAFLPLETHTPGDAAELGDFFAGVAALEAAAVEAFRVMHAELEAFGAPLELCEAVRRAALDEVRHARESAELARVFGAVARGPQIEPRPLRELFEFALDNVVEGCVREAFGAAVARHQASVAADARVRATLAGIASDECRHAELSFRIQAWLEPLLGADEHARLKLAAQAAVAELRAEQRTEPARSVQLAAGMPSAAGAAKLLDVLEAQLWSTQSWAA